MIVNSNDHKMVKLSAYCEDSCDRCHLYVGFYTRLPIHDKTGIVFHSHMSFFCSPGSRMIKKGSDFRIITPCKTTNSRLPLTYHSLHKENPTNISYTRKLKHFYEYLSDFNYDLHVDDSFNVPSLWIRKNFGSWVETWLKLVDDSEVSDVRFDYDISINYRN